MNIEDIPLTDTLAAFGVTHSRDDRSLHDGCRVLRASNGVIIGRYSAHSAWKHLDEIRSMAARVTLPK